VVRRGWHREFYYDKDTLTITPLNEDDVSKQALIERIRVVKEAHNFSNVALGDKIGVNESSVRKWLSGQYLPSETLLPKILASLTKLEDGSYQPRISLVSTSYPSSYPDPKKVTSQEDVTSEPILTEINKEIKNKDVLVRNNVKTTKTKKSKASSTINRDNPCSSCPALSTKDERFVDGEVRNNVIRINAITSNVVKLKSVKLNFFTTF